MNSNLVRERLVLIRTARAVRSVVLWNESAIVSELASADHFPLSANFHWSSDGDVLVLEVQLSLFSWCMG